MIAQSRGCDVEREDTARLNDQFVTRITELGREIDKWRANEAGTREALRGVENDLASFKRSVENRIKQVHNDGVLSMEQANEVLSDLSLPTIDLDWNVSGHYDATYHLHLEDKGLSMTVTVSVEVPFVVSVEASDEDIATEEVEGMHLSDLDLDWDNAEIDIDSSELDIEDTDWLVRALLDTEPYLTAEIVVDEIEQSRP
jgi:hypothetical protein